MSYGVLFDGFWTGPTGRLIASVGGSSAQLVALYLMGNQDANMIGLYPMRLPVARERLATLSAKALERAMAAVEQAEFARYDTVTEHVWVVEMCRYRLQLHDQKPLKEDDKRRIGAAKMFAAAKPNPFVRPFFDKYRTILRLDRPRQFKGEPIPIRYPINSPTRSVVSSQEQKISQEDQEHRASARASHAVLVRLAHDAFTSHPDDAKEELKCLAARAGIPYDAESIRVALDAVEHQRARRLG